MEVERRDVVEQPRRPDRGTRSAVRSRLVPSTTAGRSPHVLCTGTSSAVISERVYWPNRCWRGTSGSPWCWYSTWRWAKSSVKPTSWCGASSRQVPSRCSHSRMAPISSGAASCSRQDVVEPEHHQGVGVGEDPLVDRQLVARLVDALEDRDRVARRFARRVPGMPASSGGTVPACRRCPAGSAPRRTPVSRSSATGRCGPRSSWRSGCTSRPDHVGPPTGSSTSSRC